MHEAPPGLSKRRVCELLSVNRSTLYYEGKALAVDDDHGGVFNKTPLDYYGVFL